MNIFPTDRSGFASAKALDDKRVVRQASEVVVLLGAVAALDGIPSPYKPSHQPGHDLVRWLREPEHWRWTYDYALACNLLYSQLYGRECACLAKLYELKKAYAAARPVEGNHLLPARPATFANCASSKEQGLSFRHVADVHDAYRQYLNARWASDKRAPVWTGRDPPAWRVDTRAG